MTKTGSKINIDDNNILVNNKIYDFFLFNNSGICILEKQIEILFKDSKQYNNYKLLIKNLAHKILINYEKIKIDKTNDDNEKLSLNNNKNSKDNEFIFKIFQLEKCKILFMIRNSNIFVSTFPIKSSSQFQRLLLIHIFIALVNFKGDSILAMKKFNNYEKYNETDYINLKYFYTKNLNLISKEINDILELLIFENYFLKIIILHFSKVFNELFKKEYLNLNQTRFKNLYILDLNSSSIILDMVKIQGSKEEIHNKKYINNNKLFEEILYHSKNMYNSYISKNEMKYITTDSIYRFVKFECTSTFPRLLFIIKFIPVLKGIAVIHLYYQKKLSRNIENNPLDQELKYKEIDLLFGSFIKDNQNLEFKYGAPKKLQHIEKFFEEFFITNRNGLELFRTNNNYKKFIYVNYYIINIINSVPVSFNVNIDQLFADINKRLDEEYNKEMKEKREKEKLKEIKIREDNEDNESNDENKNENGDEDNSYENIFALNKEIFYNEILDIKNIENIENKDKIKSFKNMNNMNKKQISNIFSDFIGKSLISEEDKKDNNIENKTFKNTNKKKEINSIMNNENIIYTEENTERKSLIQKNNGNASINSEISNFSMISEVKSKERFKIKVINLKGNHINDKKHNIYNNNNSSKEKDYKLSELLDIINYNTKSNNDINKTQKQSIHNELTIKNTETKNLIINSETEVKK